MLQALLVDFNGPVTGYRDAGKLWKYVGKGLLKEAANYHPGRCMALVYHMIVLKGMTERYKRGKIP